MTYIRPKKKLLAFSFANFEIARLSKGKSYVCPDGSSGSIVLWIAFKTMSHFYQLPNDKS